MALIPYGSFPSGPIQFPDGLGERTRLPTSVSLVAAFDLFVNVVSKKLSNRSRLSMHIRSTGSGP